MATEFGKRLTRARDHAKLTQDELCALVPMAQSTLAAAESTGHGSRMTAQLAHHCGVNAYWLATGEGDMLDGVTHIAAESRARYHVPLSIESTVSRLAEFVHAHGVVRRSTLADLLARFARDPDDPSLQAELVALLQPPAVASTGKRASM